MARILDVDMNLLTVKESPFPEEWLLYGGRGLSSKLICDMVDPAADPLGPENVLLFCPLVLAGTAAPSGSRLSVGFKSPLTGTIKESNAGGMLGYMLGMQDIRAIIIRNKPEGDGWWLLHIDAQGVLSIKSADKYAGQNNYDLQTSLRKDFGDNIATGTIGVAGERLYYSASIITTEFLTNHPNRAAGRGGGGAVMGSRRLKAIVVEKPALPFRFPYADKDLFMKTLKRHQQAHEDSPLMGIRFIGTSGNLGNAAKGGILPVRNFSGELFEKEKLDRIEPDVMRETILSRGGKVAQRCMPGCIGMCSNEVHDKNRKFLTGSLEYETIGLCGPNCDISDFDLITEMDRFCDNIGIDTMEFGTAVGVAMDSGIIPWGDSAAVRGIMDEMYRGEGLGEKIGMGTERFGRSIGAKRIPTVKGQAISAYEPRAHKALGVTYAVSTMGADHTAGMVHTGPGGAPTDKDQKPYYSLLGQLDSMVQDFYMCTFNWGSAMSDPTILTDYIKGAFGVDATFSKLEELGVETLVAEDDFNKRAGFKPEDDDLPEFFRTQPSAMGGAVYDFTPEELQSAKQYKSLLKGMDLNEK